MITLGHGPLSDGIVVVRGLGAAEAPEIVAAATPGEATCFAPEAAPFTLEQVLTWVRGWEEGRRRRRSAAFAALDAATGDLLGGLVLQVGVPYRQHDLPWRGEYVEHPADALPDVVRVAPPAWLVELRELMPDVAEVAYWVRRSARGRGIATCALRLLSDWALDDGGLAALWAEIGSANPASARVAATAGYRLAGPLPRVSIEPDTTAREHDLVSVWSR